MFPNSGSLIYSNSRSGALQDADRDKVTYLFMVSTVPYGVR